MKSGYELLNFLSQSSHEIVEFIFFLMIRRPPRSTPIKSSAASDVYKRQPTGGSVSFNGKDLLAMPPEVRSHEGLFLGFQYPVEIPQ